MACRCANCKRPFAESEKVFDFVLGRGGPTLTFCRICKDHMLEVADEDGNVVVEGHA